MFNRITSCFVKEVCPPIVRLGTCDVLILASEVMGMKFD